MSLPDTIFIFGLALVIFGPKKLPEIGRQLGKLVVEFRRASNEFKMQIDEELRAAEEADRRKQFAAQSSPAPEVKAGSPSTEEALTIRPPTVGSTVSAANPYVGLPAEEPAALPPAAVALNSEAAELETIESRIAQPLPEHTSSHHG